MAKKVYVKDLFVEMEVKNKGVEFEVRDNDKQLGDVILKKTGIEWCKGRTTAGKGVKVSWEDFIAWVESRS